MWENWLKLAKEESGEIGETTRDAPMSQEKVVNINEQHTISESIHKPLLIIHVLANNLPVDCVSVG